ncbi:MAG: hypothetical protein AAF526_07175 [Pseudomonadota bacterium]
MARPARTGSNRVSEIDRKDSKRKVALNKVEQKKAFEARKNNFKALKRRADKLDAFRKNLSDLKRKMEEDQKLRERVAKQIAKAIKETAKLLEDSQSLIKSEQAKGVVIVSQQDDAGILKTTAPTNVGSFLVVIVALYAWLSKKLKKS